MGVFTKELTIKELNDWSQNTLISHLGIEFIAVTDQTLVATMPVEARTHQPFGVLHGGASVVLAETLGSMASNFCAPEGKYCVGLEINANHLKSVRSGTVTGTATPIHIGGKTHVWEIRIVNEQNALVCVSRLTMAVLDKM